MLYNAIVSILGTKFIIYIIMLEANTSELLTKRVDLGFNTFLAALVVVLRNHQTEMKADQVKELIKQYHEELHGITKGDLQSEMDAFYLHGGAYRMTVDKQRIFSAALTIASDSCK